MPTDISHLPPGPVWPDLVWPDPVWPDPVWIKPYGLNDGRDAVTDWLAHVSAGRIGNTPPAAPEVLARRLATEAQFAAYRRERRA